MIQSFLQRGSTKYGGSVNYVQVRALPWGATELSFFAGASPAVDNGDMAVVPTVTTPDGFVLTLSSTGVPVIASFGSTARQSMTLDVYDYSLRTWYGQVTEYVNNQAPAYIGPAIVEFDYVINVAITPINLDDYTQDAEHDPRTYATVDPLPTGLTLVGNTISGTPTVAGVYTVNFTVTDSIDAPTAFPPWTFVVAATVVVPNEVGQTQAAATSALVALGLVVTTSTVANDAFAGKVFSQSPIAGTVVFLGTTVALVIGVPVNPVPYVIGYREAEARALISSVGLVPLKGTSVHSEVEPVGYVVSQSPTAGGVSIPGQVITYVLSLGSAIVPPSPPSSPSPYKLGRIIFKATPVGVIAMVEFDFLSDLAVGETISTATLTASVYSGVDPTPSAVLIGSKTINGTKVDQKVEGGVLGTIYEIKCVITTSLSQTLQRAAFYAVKSDLP